MYRIIQLDDNGAEIATIELDEFTVEILYSGIARMLQDAALTKPQTSARTEFSREARERRARILNRINA